MMSGYKGNDCIRNYWMICVTPSALAVMHRPVTFRCNEACMVPLY